MENVLMLMIGVSIILAFVVMGAFIWGFKNKQFAENRGFLELNDSEEALNDAIILENRKKALLDKKRALFLDRDGVINKDFSYVYEVSKLEFMPNIIDVCKFFYDKGYLLIIITNQSGIGRNYYSLEDTNIFHNAIKNEFLKYDIKFSDIFICPHTPDDNCDCRKPKPKMINDACLKFNIDKSLSIFIGDKISDMQAAINAGIKHRYLFNNELADKIDAKIVSNLLDIKKDFQ